MDCTSDNGGLGPKLLAVVRELGAAQYEVESFLRAKGDGSWGVRCHHCGRYFDPPCTMIRASSLDGSGAVRYYCTDRQACRINKQEKEAERLAENRRKAAEFEATVVLDDLQEVPRYMVGAPTSAGSLSLDDYQHGAADTAVYPCQGGWVGLLYTVLGLSGEAGELANQVKKVLRDDGFTVSEERKAKLLDELGDVLWYVANMALELGVDLDHLARKNLEKLAQRKEQGTIKGDRRG